MQILSQRLPRLSAICLVGLLVSTATSQQATAPILQSGYRKAGPQITGHYQVSAAHLQDLTLPQSGYATFRFRVVLGGVPRLIELRPHSVLAKDFRLLVADQNGIRQIPASPSSNYQGEVLGVPGSLVAGTLIGGQLSALVRFDGETFGIEPARAADKNQAATTHATFRTADSTVQGVQGGTAAPHVPVPHKGQTVGPTALKESEIAIDADYNYYQRYGNTVTSTENQVRSVVNGMDVIYKRDVSITFKITQIIVRTSPVYSGTDPSSLLSQFRSRWNSQHGGVKRDHAHMFTGRGSFSGVIGVAYLGTVCNLSSAYGLSKAFSSSLTTNVGLVAHECGHNFGSPHCSGSACYIMCAGLGGCGRDVTRFGSSSISSINSYVASYGGCLGTPGPSNPPVISFLTPTSAEALHGNKITIFGSNLDTATKVTVGGNDLPTANWAIKTAQTIDFDPPTATALGAVSVTVSNPVGPSNSLAFSYTAVKTAKLYTFDTWIVNWNLPYDFAGKPGSAYVMLIAPDNQTFKLFGMDILLNLTILGSGALNPAGVGLFTINVPVALRNATIYGQVGIVTPPSALEMTNIVGTKFF